MASVRNIGLTNEEKKAENERNQASAMSVDASSTTHNRTPPRDAYWFAHGGIEDTSSKNAQDTSKSPGTDDPKDVQLQKDKEERIRVFREQQEEERLKKLKDMEQQFLQAKKHREQQEEERKRRIEEARIKEIERRQQVEERKRQIWEAEQERKEAILRRNMEREARIEARRNAQRNSQCFAFGSSTPRTFDLDLAAIGVGRNTSPGSVLMSSVSGRRSEERELGPPRATSACSLDRKFGEDCMSRSMVSLSSSAFRGRKRTDIMPTLTRERSITPHVTPRGKDSSRSPSRPQSSMSGASEISATSSSISAVNMRTRSAPRRPRPYSIAGSSTERTPIIPTNAVKKERERQPSLIEKNAQPTALPKQPRAKSANQEKSEEKEISKPKKPIPPPKSKEVLARAKSHPVPTKDNLRKPVKPTPSEVLKASSEKQLLNKEKCTEETENIQIKIVNCSEPKSEPVEIVNSSPVTSPVTDSDMCISSEDSRPITESDFNTQTFTESEGRTDVSESVNIPKEKQEVILQVVSKVENIPDKPVQKVVTNQETAQQNVSESESTTMKEMTQQKPRITSEEEARAALAEKRRLAREQAEREAELERQRQEEIRQKEEEQRHLEELEQKRMEEEAMRLAELHRQLEAEKLKKAIEEQQQREREEQEKREEEARQKAEKEEQEKKAREEAEKQRLELEERLRKEEEERAERKKRVEQIMARTRGKTAQSPASTPSENNNKPLKADDSVPSNNTAESIKANLFSSIPESKKTNHINGSATEKNKNGSLSTSISSNCVSNVNPFQILEEKEMSYSAPLPDLVNNDVIANHSVKNNGHHVESDEQLVSSKISVSNSFSSSRTLSANDATSPAQTNGYSSHEDMSCTTSPEETSDTGLLIDVESSPQNAARNTSEPADFTKLVDIDPSSLSLDNENYLISVDNVNSNILSPEKSYTGFEDCLQKKPDAASVVDLLSS